MPCCCGERSRCCAAEEGQRSAAYPAMRRRSAAVTSLDRIDNQVPSDLDALPTRVRVDLTTAWRASPTLQSNTPGAQPTSRSEPLPRNPPDQWRCSKQHSSRSRKGCYRAGSFGGRHPSARRQSRFHKQLRRTGPGQVRHGQRAPPTPQSIARCPRSVSVVRVDGHRGFPIASGGRGRGSSNQQEQCRRSETIGTLGS